MSEENPPVSPEERDENKDDLLSIFAALIHVWIALEAISKTLPEPQAKAVAGSVQGLSEVMGRLMKRHDIKVSIDREGEDDE